MFKLNFSLSFYFKFWAKIDILAIFCDSWVFYWEGLRELQKRDRNNDRPRRLSLGSKLVQMGAGQGSPQKGVYQFLI